HTLSLLSYSNIKLARSLAERDALMHSLRRSEEHVRNQNAILEGINRIFRQVLTCRTEEELGDICLQVAERLTGSKFGFIAKLSASGRLDDVAISDPGWDACRISRPDGHGRFPQGLEVHG